MKKKTHRKTEKAHLQRNDQVEKLLKKNHMFFLNDLVWKVSLEFIRHLFMVASYFLFLLMMNSQVNKEVDSWISKI